MYKYSDTHEWVDFKDGIATVGVTHFAQQELGEVVYVELPEIGKTVNVGEEVAVLESTKAAADIYSPLTGTITEVNHKLDTASELVNKSPEKEGWLFKMKPTDPNEINKLMDEITYKGLVSGQ